MARRVAAACLATLADPLAFVLASSAPRPEDGRQQEEVDSPATAFEVEALGLLGSGDDSEGSRDPECVGGRCVLKVPYLVRYHNYEGFMNVSGKIDVLTSGGHQILRWQLYGADLNCGTVPPRPGSNDCGIHIHAGTSCAQDAGPHLHKVSKDPWTAVQYATDLVFQGRSFQWTRNAVYSGLGNDEIRGRTVVVHNLQGARIACGIIGEPAENGNMAVASGFVPYAGYTGRLRTTGEVTVRAWSADTDYLKQSFPYLVLSWSLQGVCANCLNRQYLHGAVSNDCGIHIHEGRSCEGPAGAHLFHTASDPWKLLHYGVHGGALRGFSPARSKGTGVQVVAGLTLEDVKGRTMIVHNYKGERIACAILN